MALRIVFFGTSAFALPSLEVVRSSPHQIVGVVTAPDARRRGVPMATPVRRWAQQHRIATLTPDSPRDPELRRWLETLNADLFLVIAYKKLPPEIWRMPPKGTVNLHASLLPDYRGAAPIHHALIAGEPKTGVTTFYIADKIDTGDIIFQEAVPIEPHDTFGTLHDRLAEVGSGLVLRTLNAIDAGTAPRIPQVMQSAKKAPKLTKEFCRIRWDQPADRLHNFIRGLSPFPGAWTLHAGKRWRILQGRPVEGEALPPGEFRIRGGTLEVGTGSPNQPYRVDQLHLEGKRPMRTEEAIRGRLLPPEGRLE